MPILLVAGKVEVFSFLFNVMISKTLSREDTVSVDTKDTVRGTGLVHCGAST